jgi:chromosome partitioning protein
MVVTIASFKGGVGKTTTAVHLGAFLQELAATMVVDGDPNRSVTDWGKPGRLPFAIVDERQSAFNARRFEHIVIDTKARPEEEDLKALALGCNLLIIPCTPDPLALRTLELTVTALRNIGAERYRILLTAVPPAPQPEGPDAKQLLAQLGIPVFNRSIRRVKAFQRAVLQGTTVREVRDDRSVVAWNDYEEVGQELINIVQVPALRGYQPTRPFTHLGTLREIVHERTQEHIRRADEYCRRQFTEGWGQNGAR